MSGNPERQLRCQCTPWQREDVGLDVACVTIQVTLRSDLQGLAGAPSFPDSPTSQVLSSLLPATAPVASLLHTSWTCLLILNASPKLSTPSSVTCRRGKNRKKKHFCYAVKYKNSQLLQRGLVPGSSFPDTLNTRSDESQSLISDSSTESPLQTGCRNTALIFPPGTNQSPMDRNLYIHVLSPPSNW